MPANVLVVDDDELVQTTLKDILEDAGYQVETAGDGLAALAKLEDLVPSVILLDITMPRMDGYALAARLAQLGVRVPLVVLTADGHAREKAAQMGAVDWVNKPFTLDRLLEAVSNAGA